MARGDCGHVECAPLLYKSPAMIGESETMAQKLFDISPVTEDPVCYKLWRLVAETSGKFIATSGSLSIREHAYAYRWRKCRNPTTLTPHGVGDLQWESR